MTSNFLSYVKNSKLLELYFSLSPDEKEILNKYGAQHLVQQCYKEDVFSPKTICQYLWVSAANVIPQGYYSLAEKLLLEALALADNDLDKGHIHSNLVQIYADQNMLEECHQHCKEIIETGYFVPWAEKMLSSLSS